MENQPSLLELLPLFTDPRVPERGEHEQALGPLRWEPAETGSDPALPGGGLARHSMLYVGELHNRIYLIHEGKVIWHYDTGTELELDDIFMLVNGNVMFSHLSWCAEVTPDKRLVWRYQVPAGCEVHSLQPIGLKRVLMIQNGPVPKVIILNKETGRAEYTHDIPYDSSLPVHSQFRRIRMTQNNTFLIPFLDMHQVVEYDMDFNEVWRYETPRPWACDRLPNGNNLITDEAERKVIEVNQQGETVWEFCHDQIPEPYRISGSQSCVRLRSGNTILCSMGGLGKGPQLVEVTPDKKVVWCLKDWKNLGPATSIQVLSEPVDPILLP